MYKLTKLHTSSVQKIQIQTQTKHANITIKDLRIQVGDLILECL